MYSHLIKPNQPHPCLERVAQHAIALVSPNGR